ncbi:AttE component of AttEFGH ABC transport system [Nitrincola lacisaponensis]|uniref:AttE component of AttEFGH ABC transport system n=1 Tax=Nitrincola lacisaponensis TaxID=267850 RepID=A0A063YA81_9GAMM|nr:ABC transporter ATP-binding protein [Nitrincola lacisaponensis]KDE41237.1 AttE component of AttEFGH ABC transport system [Nitrincola lacisaponensis]
MLKVTNLAKSHSTPQGTLELFRGLQFSVHSGESVALMGESGCGKSTLLHLIAGLEDADAGQILLSGQDVTAMNDSQRARLRRHALGIIFQQLNLIPSLTVHDNLAFQARLAKCLQPDRLTQLIETLGLTELLPRYPHQLSGGQQQRVAIGRALAARPTLLLADEPTGSLDEQNADQVMDLLLTLVQQTGTSLLMVTHSQRLARRMDRCLTLHQGQLT